MRLNRNANGEAKQAAKAKAVEEKRLAKEKLAEQKKEQATQRLESKQKVQDEKVAQKVAQKLDLQKLRSELKETELQEKEKAKTADDARRGTLVIQNKFFLCKPTCFACSCSLQGANCLMAVWRPSMSVETSSSRAFCVR